MRVRNRLSPDGNILWTIVPDGSTDTTLLQLFVSDKFRAGRRLIIHSISGEEVTIGWADPPNGAEAAPAEAAKPCECTHIAECAGGSDNIHCRIDEFKPVKLSAEAADDLLLAPGYNAPKNRMVTNTIVKAIEADKYSIGRKTEGEWRHFIFMTIGKAFEEKVDDPQWCKVCEMRFFHPCTSKEEAETCRNRGVVRRSGPPWAGTN